MTLSCHKSYVRDNKAALTLRLPFMGFRGFGVIGMINCLLFVCHLKRDALRLNSHHLLTHSALPRVLHKPKTEPGAWPDRVQLGRALKTGQAPASLHTLFLEILFVYYWLVFPITISMKEIMFASNIFVSTHEGFTVNDAACNLALLFVILSNISLTVYCSFSYCCISAVLLLKPPKHFPLLLLHD